MYRSSGQDSNKPTEEQSSVIAAKRQTADLSTDGRITLIFFLIFNLCIYHGSKHTLSIKHVFSLYFHNDNIRIQLQRNMRTVFSMGGIQSNSWACELLLHRMSACVLQLLGCSQLIDQYAVGEHEHGFSDSVLPQSVCDSSLKIADSVERSTPAVVWH